MDNINKNNQAFGIDLGTTNSLVATMREFRPVIIEFAPSLAYYGKNDETIIGEEVLDYSISDPINTVSSVKRWIGNLLIF